MNIDFKTKWNNGKEKINIYKIFTIAFALLLFIQMCVVVYLNLVQLRYHTGYDTSSYLIKAMEIYKQKTFFIKNWNHQTTLYMDNAMTIAVFLYAITKNIWLSFGIADCIVVGILLALFGRICRKLGMNTTVTLVALNLFTCPYLMEGLNNWNDLGYFAMLFTTMASYGVKTVTILLFINVFLDMEEKKCNLFLLIASLGLSFLSGLSSGFYIAVTVMVPAYILLGIRLLRKNDWKVLLHPSVYFTVGSSVAIVSGNWISKNIIHFESYDGEMVWTSIRQFWSNFTSIFEGYLELLGGLPAQEGMLILNRHGIIYLCPLFILAFSLLAIGYGIYYFIRHYDENSKIQIFVLLIVFAIALFSIVFTTYGADVFEARFLIEPYIASIFLMGFFLQQLDDKLIFKGLLILGVLGSVIIINAKSDYTYLTTLSYYDEMEEIVQKVDKLDSPVVYLVGDDIMCEQRLLRPMDTSKVYKSFGEEGNVHHYGDYTYYDENGEYAGPTIMIATDDAYPKISEYIKKQYAYYDEVGMYKIYTSENNILDNARGITESKVNVDYPYTFGLNWALGSFQQEDGTFLTDGSEGTVLTGPDNSVAVSGTYAITLHYETSDKISASTNSDTAAGSVSKTADSTEQNNQMLGTFSILKNGESIASEPIMTSESAAVLQNVIFAEGDTISYEITENEGSIWKIQSIEIIRNE